MTQIEINEASKQLDHLMHLALQGEDVVLTEAGAPIVRLVPVSQDDVRGRRKKRRAGSARGLITMSPDFDSPLNEFREYTE